MNAERKISHGMSDNAGPEAFGVVQQPRVGHSWPRTPQAMNTCLRPDALGGCYGHWMSSLNEAGCAPGINLVEMGPPKDSDPTVGSGGGYGGIYCFALMP